MKKYIYLFFISFCLSNCYSYKVSAPADETNQNTKIPEAKSKSRIPNGTVALASPDAQDNRQRSTKQEKPSKPKPANITEKLEPNKYYKINVADKSYKIQVDKWVSDSLVAHVIHKPKKILKFHKNQIDQANIAERRFSQPVADIITVAAYTGIGVGIWALVSQ